MLGWEGGEARGLLKTCAGLNHEAAHVCIYVGAHVCMLVPALLPMSSFCFRKVQRAYFSNRWTSRSAS